MEIYRWFVIVLLFLMAVMGAIIASLIGCVDRNPVVNEEGRVLNQIPISWVIFGLSAFVVIGSVVVLLMSYIRKGLQVFSGITFILMAVTWGIAIAMVVAYWPWINKPLNEQKNGERLEMGAVLFYFIGGILISLLCMVALMIVISIAIQDSGCEPKKVDIPVGMYKCNKSQPIPKTAKTGTTAGRRLGF